MTGNDMLEYPGFVEVVARDALEGTLHHRDLFDYVAARLGDKPVDQLIEEWGHATLDRP